VTTSGSLNPGRAGRIVTWCALAGGAFTLICCVAPAGDGTTESGGSVASVEPGARAPIERDVERLIGLSRERLREMLGASAFARRDGPAEIWRYATDDCFLTVFLHRGDQARNATLTVQHVEAHPRNRASAAWVNKRSCYGQILEIRGIATAAG